MLSNVNFISSGLVKREKASLPIDVRPSKKPFLKRTLRELKLKLGL